MSGGEGEEERERDREKVDNLAKRQQFCIFLDLITCIIIILITAIAMRSQLQKQDGGTTDRERHW